MAAGCHPFSKKQSARQKKPAGNFDFTGGCVMIFKKALQTGFHA